MTATGKMANEGNKFALELVLGIGSPSIPANVYIGLATALVNEDSTLATITECTDAGYTRKEVTFDTPTEVGDAMLSASTNTLEFGAFTTGGTAITHAFLTDAVSGTSGKCLACFTLSATRYTNEGETLVIMPSNVTISYD